MKLTAWLQGLCAPVCVCVCTVCVCAGYIRNRTSSEEKLKPLEPASHSQDLNYDDFKGKMYEDGYLNDTELLENPGAKEDASSSCYPEKPLSYSTGKFKNGAIGLCNIGVKSCLNPLLQTFYMNQDFADILCRVGKVDNNVAPERRFPYELLVLFEEMQNSEEDAVAPYRILSCLRTHKVRLFSPYDVAELFLTLVDLLLEQMPHPYLEEQLRNLYTIRLEESVTCLKCSHQRSSDTNLLTIPLQLYRSRYHRTMTLERGLQAFFKPKESNGGDSWSACPKCGEDSKSVKVERFRSLPRTLTVHLRRLRQRKSSQLQKIIRTLTFPPTLDLSEVLDPEHLPEQEYAQSQYNYNIFAVVAHSGTPNSGHFCTYIKSWKDQKWYCFNDSSVCRVSWDDVKCAYGNTIFHWGVTACLLIYIQSDGK